MTTIEKTSAQATIDLALENPADIFRGELDVGDFLDAVREAASAAGNDVSSDAARKRLISAARKVVGIKSALDKAGAESVAEHKRKVAEVDGIRKRIRDGLDEIRDAIRRPVTLWEEQQKARLESQKAILVRIDELSRIPADAGASVLEAHIRELHGIETDKGTMGDYAALAQSKVEGALRMLTSALERERTAEADRRELARLRAQQQEQEEAAARARAEEEEKAAAARREAEIKAREEAAAERARQEAEEKAAKKAEQERIAAEQRVRAQEDEDRKRRENARHRSRVLNRARDALVEKTGIDEDQARAVVTAITNGSIPNVEVRF